MAAEKDSHEAVSGTVVDIEHDLARVLIGDREDEWFFPMQTLPEGTHVGTAVLFTEENGRYTALGLARSGSTSVDRSIEDRLANRLLLRKTADFRMSDLRAEIEDD